MNLGPLILLIANATIVGIGVYFSQLWVSVGVAVLLNFVVLYGMFAPESKMYGATISRLPGNERWLVLTFDDGPHPEFTPALLDILKRHNAPATFFFVGKNMKEYPQLVKRTVNESHEVGNHTLTHPFLIGKSPSLLHREIADTQQIAEEVLGAQPRLFRAPYGARDPVVLRAVRNQHLLPVQWSITSWDWTCPGTEKLVQRVNSALHPGAIILFHDGNENAKHKDRTQTLEAVDQLIPMARAQGYEFVRIPDSVEG